MITPPAYKNYRPKVSTVTPRSARPLPEMCASHPGQLARACPQCALAATPKLERGIARQLAERDAAAVIAKVDARRAKPRKPKGKPGRPSAPEGRRVKNGYDEHGRQRYRTPKDSRAKATPERRAEVIAKARDASVAARKAKEEQIALPDGRVLPVSDAARALGLRVQTVWRRRNYQRMTARQALGLDPVISEAAE